MRPPVDSSSRNDNPFLHRLSPEVRWNAQYPTARLVEEAVRREEGLLTDHGALVCVTGKHTGRSPRDRFIVRDPSTEKRVAWGNVNQPLSPESSSALAILMERYLKRQPAFVQDCFVGADRDHRIGVRVFTEYAWHSLFARNMFLRPTDAERASFNPEFALVHAPGLTADPKKHGTSSESFVVLDLARRLILIGGTRYAGEIKKAMFSVMNARLPGRGVLPMHCAANVGAGGDVAVFFGLSGTGKTTLSADPERRLIGDDEHGWGDAGVFNLEGGCYAKVIRLSADAEPQIHAATRRFGTILENVLLDAESRVTGFESERLTENTRASYDLDAIPNAVREGRSGHPKNVVFLACDAFGVLPPVAKLTPEQAAYHFLSGYTAKVAGTEVGIREPQATFSACFGAAFMPLPPSVYADLLSGKLAKHGASAWLLNTGWTGGPFGVGERMKIEHSRTILRAVLDGTLERATFRRDPIFGFAIPEMVPGVPTGILDSRSTWSDGEKYDMTARKLAAMFVKNFEPFASMVGHGVQKAGPHIA